MYLSYLLVFLVLLILGVVIAREYLRRKVPNQQSIEEILKKASHFISNGNWECASQVLEPLLNSELGGLDALIMEIQILRGTKHIDEAIAKSRSAPEQYRFKFSLLREEAKSYLAKGMLKEAVDTFKQCKTILRSEEDILDFSEALFKTGDIHGCWKALREYVHQSKSGRVLALAGDCHFCLGNWERAIAFYEKTQGSGWDNYQVLFRLAQSFQNLGRWNEAQANFKKILDKDPSDVAATLGLGTCFEEKKNYELALKSYQLGTAWESGHPELLLRAGVCAVYLRAYAYGKSYLSEALSRGVKTAQLLAFLGFTLEKEGKWVEAQKVYFQLIKEFPEHVAGYRALAWLYGVGRSVDLDAHIGVKMALKALELLPDSTSWEVLSACKARSGDFIEAHEIQEKLSIQSRDESTRLRRCRAMRSLRKKVPLDEHHVSKTLVA